jgi:hypothetical protein
MVPNYDSKIRKKIAKALPCGRSKKRINPVENCTSPLMPK